MVRLWIPAISAAVVVDLLLLATITGIVVAKRYDLSPGWRAINNASLDGPADAGEPSYRILRAGQQPIVSYNGSFSLAFYSPKGTQDYYLSVLLNPGVTKPAPASLVVPIWMANSNSSISENAVLMLTNTHKKFILLGSNGSLIWSSGSIVGILGVDLDETGNLMFYSGNGNVLWQSFEHPSDVLVPGQTLRSGISLVSSNGGQFRGTMETNGFVFYVLPETEPTMADMLRKPQPYQVWSIGGDKRLDSALKSCGATMEVSFAGIEISSSGDCGGAGNPRQVYRNESRLSSTRYWKLEEDGDFVLREFYETEQNWGMVFALSSLSKASCRHPTSCGSYGLCTTQGKCQCVGDEDLDDHTSNSCGPPPGVSISCLANEAINHHFVKIPSATYFSIEFSTPDVERSSLDDCAAVCASNCSCAAAFFGENNRSCFLVDEMMGSLRLDSDQADYTALIKIQNKKLDTRPLSANGARTSRSARTAIVFLAVLCGVLAVMLAVGFYVVKTRYPHAYNKIMRRT